MSLVPFGEEIYDTVVDVNNGQSTETFRLGDDSELDVDVEPSVSGLSFSANGGGTVNGNTWYAFNPESGFGLSARLTLDHSWSDNCSGDTFTHIEINGNSVGGSVSDYYVDSLHTIAIYGSNTCSSDINVSLSGTVTIVPNESVTVNSITKA